MDSPCKLRRLRDMAPHARNVTLSDALMPVPAQHLHPTHSAFPLIKTDQKCSLIQFDQKCTKPKKMLFLSFTSHRGEYGYSPALYIRCIGPPPPAAAPFCCTPHLCPPTPVRYAVCPWVATVSQG